LLCSALKDKAQNLRKDNEKISKDIIGEIPELLAYIMSIYAFHNSAHLFFVNG
jgi:hypothetical protein